MVVGLATKPPLMSARGVVMERIREALADRPASPESPRDYRTTTPPGTDVPALFEERVADYQATVRRCTKADLAATVAAILAERGLRRLAVPADLDPSWLSAVPSDVELVPDDPPLSHTQLDAVDGVLTGSAIGIAETGTIVLDHGPGQGRRALSLLPDCHVCVVREDAVVGSVPDALPRLDPRRPLTWISGPSATSDIELQRVEGVHGPRTLEVILVG
jgi:L-lactate dehydrogenase complex protein LldG